MDLLQESPVDYLFLRSSAGNVNQFDNMLVDSNDSQYYPLDEFTSNSPLPSFTAVGDSIAANPFPKLSSIPFAQVKPEPSQSSPAAIATPVEPQQATITLLAPIPTRKRGRPRKSGPNAQLETADSTAPVIRQSVASEPRTAMAVEPVASQNSSEDSDDESDTFSGDSRHSKNREVAFQ